MELREGNDRFCLECSCGCGILEFERWNGDDEEIFLSYYIRSDHAKWFIRIAKRIKVAWGILIGKDSFVWGMCVPNSDLNKFKDFINSLK